MSALVVLVDDCIYAYMHGCICMGSNDSKMISKLTVQMQYNIPLQ